MTDVQRNPKVLFPSSRMIFKFSDLEIVRLEEGARWVAGWRGLDVRAAFGCCEPGTARGPGEAVGIQANPS
jgi:hypothetical protein